MGRRVAVTFKNPTPPGLSGSPFSAPQRKILATPLSTGIIYNSVMRQNTPEMHQKASGGRTPLGPAVRPNSSMDVYEGTDDVKGVEKDSGTARMGKEREGEGREGESGTEGAGKRGIQSEGTVKISFF